MPQLFLPRCSKSASIEGMERVRGFAGRRVRLFSLAAIATAGGLFAIALAACSSNESTTTERGFDAARPPPPGPCTVSLTAVAACEAGSADIPDAGPIVEVDAASADASTDASLDAGAVEPLPPRSENRCLVTSDIAVACPASIAETHVVAGRGDATELLVSQRGRAYYANPKVASLVNDDNAYLQLVHLAPSGSGSVTMDPIAPYQVTSPTTVGTGIMAGSASTDASFLKFSTSATGGSALQTGTITAGTPVTLGAPFETPKVTSLDPFFSVTGEGFLLVKPFAESFALLRGLPETPSVVTTTIPSLEVQVVRTDPAGVPAGLFYKRDPNGSTSGELRLLEGETFGTERWKAGARGGAIDLAYFTTPTGNIPVMLIGDLGDTLSAVVLRSNDPLQAYAQVGASFSTCSRATYLGLTCDACPVDEVCETGSDQIRSIRLFTRQNRVFAAYYSTDVRRRKGFSLDKTPIIGVGCVCAVTEREKHEFADSLVVVEIVARAEPTSAPVVVERMRLPLYKARTSGDVTISPRPDGDLDVLFAPPPNGYQNSVTEARKEPAMLRVLRVSTASIP